MKKEIRKKYRNIRKNIPNKSELDKIIYNKVINNPHVKKANTILTYVSTKEEVDTINLIKYFLNNKLVAVPKIENNIMNFYYINSLEDLEIGNYNILEPTNKFKVTNFDNTVSLTPGICFSKDLYRIGYGGGYYDKFYENNNIYSIGLTYKACLIDTINKDEFDKKVNLIITD